MSVSPSPPVGSQFILNMFSHSLTSCKIGAYKMNHSRDMQAIICCKPIWTNRDVIFGSSSHNIFPFLRVHHSTFNLGLQKWPKMTSCQTISFSIQNSHFCNHPSLTEKKVSPNICDGPTFLNPGKEQRSHTCSSLWQLDWSWSTVQLGVWCRSLKWWQGSWWYSDISVTGYACTV